MWADAVNDQSYTFDALLPYYKKSVNFTAAKNHLRASNASILFPNEATAFETGGGPLHVSFPNWANPYSSWLLKAWNRVGIKQVADLVSGSLIGIQYASFVEDPTDETRSSSASSFLRLALETTGMAVYKNTLAKRILFAEGTKKASGVLVSTGPKSYELKATKEVIISAGTVSCHFGVENWRTRLTIVSFVRLSFLWSQE